MRVRDRLLNLKEEIVLSELKAIGDDNALRAFASVRMSDVIDKGLDRLSTRQFDFFTRAHFDFVITDADTKPLMVVEYDGPTHSKPEQVERDNIKNGLCRDAGLGILRINDNYVTKLWKGITLLRWIVEVVELEKAFEAARDTGAVPQDEPFSPIFLSRGDREFPYWLSDEANQSFHKFFATLDPTLPKGSSGFHGTGVDGSSHYLGCLYWGDHVLAVKTAMRQQDLAFPADELLDEIGTCDLGERLKLWQAGEMAVTTKAEFEVLFRDWCTKYSTTSVYGHGAFPLEIAWNLQEWRFDDGTVIPAKEAGDENVHGPN